MKIVESPTGSGKSAWAAASPRFVDSDSPRLSGLPHDTWRENQLETQRWLCDKPGSVIVLTRTKSLQKQYGSQYNAAVLFGRGNYDCAHPDALGAKCDACLFQLQMSKCPFACRCEYMVAKDIAKASSFTALNYAYWLSAGWPAKDGRAYVYLDEAHNLAEITLDWAGCRVSDKDRADWQLPAFPVIEHRHANTLLRLPPPTDLALGWLQEARDAMADWYRQLRNDKSEKGQERLRKCENLGRKLKATLVAIQTCADEWYVRSGLRGLEYKGQPVPGLVARPLTAKHHFGRYFLNGSQIVAMSATIGQPDTFAAELGVTDYQFKVVPSRFPPERRPIHILDVPPMSSKATDMDFEYQAEVIADFIRQYPPGWSGLIHVSRISEEKLLCQRLARYGLGNRVYYIKDKQDSYTPTDAQLAAWHKRKQRVPNSLLVTCSFGEGYDGLDEKINISAKIPFRLWGREDSYDRAWATYSRKRYNQAAAVALMQAQGRNRRGREEDYDGNGQVRGANAVADGSLGRIESYLSESFKEALTT